MRVLLKWWMAVIAIPGLLVMGSCQFLKTPDIPYAELESRYATQQSKFIDLPSGVHMHFRDQGNHQGRTLLLIHGFGVNLESWEPWVKVLSAEYRLVSLDLPGHGLTRVPAAYKPSPTRFADLSAELAARLGIKRYTVVGNSLGGNVAWELALRHPDNLDALVLIDAAGWYDTAPLENAVQAFSFLNDTSVRFLAQFDPKPLLITGLKTAFDDNSLVTERVVNRYNDMALAPGHREMLSNILRSITTAQLASNEKLAGIQVPTLILWGKKDRIIPVDDAQKFKTAIAGSAATIYSGIGHLPQEEDTATSARNLKTFLDALPEQRGTQRRDRVAVAAGT